VNEKASPSPEGIWQYAGENLRRLKSSGVYYVFAKHGGKQISRSLKTADKAAATRLRNDFLNDLAALSSDDAAKLTFDQVAARWTEADKFTLKASTITRRDLCVRILTPYFSGLQIRHITPRHCEAWLCHVAPGAVVHQNGVRVNFAGKADRFQFARVNIQRKVYHFGRLHDYPFRQRACPLAHGWRRVRLLHFMEHRRRNHHSAEQFRQDSFRTAQNQVVQRGSVRDNDAHERERIFSKVALSAVRSAGE
jgi:hypothetical protein